VLININFPNLKLIIISIFFLTTSLISFLLFILGSFLSKKNYLDREKLRPFECGFNPKSLPRIPFSIRFFLIAVIFLVFDVELVLIFPFIPLVGFILRFFSPILLYLFILILFVGLYYEINQGRLRWAN